MDDLDLHPKMRWKNPRTQAQQEQLERLIARARVNPVKLSPGASQEGSATVTAETEPEA